MGQAAPENDEYRVDHVDQVNDGGGDGVFGPTHQSQSLAIALPLVGGNIALSPQCGFASVEEGNSIDKETQWRKIDLLVASTGLLD